MNRQLDSLMQKEMTRKEFLVTLGIGAASVFGISSILRLLNGKSSLHGVSAGYGSSVYGGAKQRAN